MQTDNDLKSILIAEDNEPDAMWVKHLLRLWKVENPVHSVLDGDSLLKYLRGEEPFADRSKYRPPVLVFLDLKLPDMTGLQVMDKMRRENFQVPVVILTAHRSQDHIIKAQNLGVHTFLEKPLENEQFIKVVTSWRGVCTRTTERGIQIHPTAFNLPNHL